MLNAMDTTAIALKIDIDGHESQIVSRQRVLGPWVAQPKGRSHRAEPDRSAMAAYFFSSLAGLAAFSVLPGFSAASPAAGASAVAASPPSAGGTAPSTTSPSTGATGVRDRKSVV